MPADTRALAEVVVKVSTALEAAAPQLRALDAAVGDGDLGLTVTLGARAVRDALQELDEVEPATLLASCGKAFASANPSTMGALVGTGLQEAARAVRGKWELEVADFGLMIRAAYEGMQRRGKAEPGQKTILDSLGPSAKALENGLAAGRSGIELAEEARRAAEEGAAASDALQSEIGRASWVGERTRGCRDPGAQTWVVAIRAIEDAVATPRRFNGRSAGE